MQQNPINHVAVVLDASSSMSHLVNEVVRVTDQQIKDLAELSTQLGQETRISIYTFADPSKIRNLIFDKDVLRLDSIAGHYMPHGNTALIDATLKAIDNLEKTATLYGDHSFLLYVLTDGEENASLMGPPVLAGKLKSLPHNWTVAGLVPNQSAKFKATAFGFAPGNVAVWDASSEAGMREAGRVIRDSTAGYMTARASGLKSTTGLFDMGAAAVNHKTVTQNLKELTGFRVEHVKQPAVIKDFIESLRPKVAFVQGANFFPFIKREKINDSKEIIIRHKVSGKIYGGPAARAMVGLPDSGEVSVKPQPNPEYDVFVQSTSLNRNLIAGHDLLIRV